MKNRIIEVHNKTIIPIGGCLITITGYWIWNVALASLYGYDTKTRLLYHIRDGFTKHHGRDLTWWLILILTLLSVLVFELGVQSLRKTFFPTDTDIFQVLQKDPVIRKRFEETLRREEEGYNLPEEEKMDEKEAGVDGLLAGAKAAAEVQLQPLQPSEKPRGRGLLMRKKKSVDEEMEMKTVSR